MSTTKINLLSHFLFLPIIRSKVCPTSTAADPAANSPYSSLDKKVSMKGVNLEELIVKGLKRINDLIARPVDRKSADELEKRLSEINVSQKWIEIYMRMYVYTYVYWF